MLLKNVSVDGSITVSFDSDCHFVSVTISILGNFMSFKIISEVPSSLLGCYMVQLSDVY